MDIRHAEPAGMLIDFVHRQLDVDGAIKQLARCPGLVAAVKNRHHRIAHELVDNAAMAVNDAHHGPEIVIQQFDYRERGDKAPSLE